VLDQLTRPLIARHPAFVVSPYDLAATLDR